MFAMRRHGRVGAGLDRVVLGGQAEGVETHRVEDVEAVHPEVAAIDVGGRIALGMADVEAGARRIGEHVEYVAPLVLRVCRILGRAEGLLGLPPSLPFPLDLPERVLGHGTSSPLQSLLRRLGDTKREEARESMTRDYGAAGRRTRYLSGTACRALWR